jgi:hypothetical protein
VDSYPYLVDIDTYERHRAQVLADAAAAARADGYEPQGQPAVHVIVELPVRARVPSTPARVA